MLHNLGIFITITLSITVNSFQISRNDVQKGNFFHFKFHYLDLCHDKQWESSKLYASIKHMSKFL